MSASPVQSKHPQGDESPTAESLAIGQRVSILSNAGTVQFCGTPSFAQGIWVGVALDEPLGKNNGTVQDVSYFECKENHGLFVRPEQCKPLDGTAKAKRRQSVAQAAESSPTAKAIPETPKAKAKAPPPGGHEEEQNKEKRKEMARLRGEGKKLQDVLESKVKELAATKTRRQGVQQDIVRIEKVQGQANAAKQKESDEWQKKMLECKNQSKALKSEMPKLQAKRMELRSACEALEQEIEAKFPAAAASLRERSRLEVALEKAKRDFIELQSEELELKVEELKEKLERIENDNVWTEKKALEWHKQALEHVAESHDHEVMRLLRKVAVLERQQKVAPGLSPHKLEEVSRQRKTVDTLRSQNEVLDQSVKAATLLLEERRKLRSTGQEMSEAVEQLEHALSEELQACEERQEQLAAVILHLHDTRNLVKQRRRETMAEVARLETRLKFRAAEGKTKHGLPAKRSYTYRGEDQVEMFTQRIDGLLMEAEADGKQARYSVWASCIPKEVQEEALVGNSFRILCGLQSCMLKSEVLSRTIHTYITSHLAIREEKAVLKWLCKVSLFGSQLVVSLLGLIGRLKGCTEERFRKLMLQPSLSSAAEGEDVLDEVRDIVSEKLWCGVSESGKRSEEVLTMLSAMNSQVQSLEKTLFKDEPFISCEAVAAAAHLLCATASFFLEASDDAGGGRRERWIGLSLNAQRTVERLSKTSIDAGYGFADDRPETFMTIEPNVLAEYAAVAPATSIPLKAVMACVTLLKSEKPLSPQKSEPAPEPAQRAKEAAAPDTTPDSKAKADANPAATEEAKENAEAEEKAETEAAAGKNQKLNEHWESLLRQAAVMISASNSAVPISEASHGAMLDRALSQAELDLKGLEQLKACAVSRNLAPRSPWSQATRAYRRKVDAAMDDLPSVREAAEKGLRHVEEKMANAEERLKEEKLLVAEVEQKFSAGRTTAERCNLAQETVRRMQLQGETNVKLKIEFEEQLTQEKNKNSKTELEVLEMKSKCQDTQQQLQELDVQLAKRMRQQVPPEVVLALRRNVERQRRELLAVQQRYSESTALQQLRKSNEIIATEDVWSCWRSVVDTQDKLLLEQAKSSVVPLDRARASAPARQETPGQTQLTQVTLALPGLRLKIDKLFKELVEGRSEGAEGQMKEPGAEETHHGSTALARYFNAMSKALQQGPSVRISLPRPDFQSERAKAEAQSVTTASWRRFIATAPVPVFANSDELASLHRALL